MGVVVSGEAGRTGNLKDKKSFNAVTAENDYGLIIVAFDHAVHFFGSWWVGSLSRRIQVNIISNISLKIEIVLNTDLH
jgi:hypothetical protein